jgi:hypothetical protein
LVGSPVEAASGSELESASSGCVVYPK